MIEDRSHTARKELDDNVDEEVFAGIINARAVAKWTKKFRKEIRSVNHQRRGKSKRTSKCIPSD
jgi:hypothetical protein